MISFCGSTTAIAPIGLSQCSRPLSPTLAFGAGRAFDDAAALALLRRGDALRRHIGGDEEGVDGDDHDARASAVHRHPPEGEPSPRLPSTSVSVERWRGPSIATSAVGDKAGVHVTSRPLPPPRKCAEFRPRRGRHGERPGSRELGPALEQQRPEHGAVTSLLVFAVAAQREAGLVRQGRQQIRAFAPRPAGSSRAGTGARTGPTISDPSIAAQTSPAPGSAPGSATRHRRSRDVQIRFSARRVAVCGRYRGERPHGATAVIRASTP